MGVCCKKCQKKDGGDDLPILEGKESVKESTTKKADDNDTVWAQGVTTLQTDVSEQHIFHLERLCTL